MSHEFSQEDDTVAERKYEKQISISTVIIIKIFSQHDCKRMIQKRLSGRFMKIHKIRRIYAWMVGVKHFFDLYDNP